MYMSFCEFCRQPLVDIKGTASFFTDAFAHFSNTRGLQQQIEANFDEVNNFRQIEVEV